MKTLMLLTTYKREEKLVRFLQDLNNKIFCSIKTNLEILICDDDPCSKLPTKLMGLIKGHVLNVYYTRNERNLGQGPNAMYAMSANRNYDYYWIPGDDDLLIPDMLTKLLDAISKFQPAVAVIEFRQGKNLSLGTFFQGESRLVEDVNDSIEFITRYGKGISTIFRRPSDWAIDIVSKEFSECMYQDKVLAILALLEADKRFIYLQTELTATGDADFGRLRYSQRVFLNLKASVNYAKKLYAIRYGCILDHGSPAVDKFDSLKMWAIGLRSHFDSRSEVSYTNKRLAIEVFVYPFQFLLRLLGVTSSRFEK